MIRHYCDGCGNEITYANKVDGRLRSVVPSTYSGVIFEIMVGSTKPGHGGLWNNGEWCKYCILDAIAKLDDRPMLQRVTPVSMPIWDTLTPGQQALLNGISYKVNGFGKKMYDFCRAIAMGDSHEFEQPSDLELDVRQKEIFNHPGAFSEPEPPPHRSGTTQVNDTPDSMREA